LFFAVLIFFLARPCPHSESDSGLREEGIGVGGVTVVKTVKKVMVKSRQCRQW
jgi:hypothetical protein